MRPLTAEEFGERIRRVEEALGGLSPMQKVFLGTDGSVTNLLEMATGHPVEVTTLVQEVVAADAEIADALDVDCGDDVNYRVVELIDGETKETLIYAVSYTPLKRLAPEFRQDLMRADIPIGKILRRHRIESRREITDVGIVPADPRLAGVFGIYRQESLLSRKYRIIHHQQPLIAIEEVFPLTSFAERGVVVVDAPSRIHITLLDMNGSLGRVDGGVGIALDRPNTVLNARKHTELIVLGGSVEERRRVLEAARKVLDHYALLGGAEITLHAVVPQHAGLGSGTQVALAAAGALCRLYRQDASSRDLAVIVGRGGTSGIGTAAFGSGGFILDGGHRFGGPGGKQDFMPSSASRGIEPPPVLARHPFPEDWRILLAIPDIAAGAHGKREIDIFRTSCPVPLGEVRELCHEVLMRMLPGLVEHDLDLFGSAVNRVQHLGFKRVELAMQPPIVPALVDAMVEAGAACAGLSSFGPTVYAIGDTDMEDAARAAGEILGGQGTVLLTKARNCGAVVREVT